MRIALAVVSVALFIFGGTPVNAQSEIVPSCGLEAQGFCLEGSTWRGIDCLAYAMYGCATSRRDNNYCVVASRTVAAQVEADSATIEKLIADCLSGRETTLSGILDARAGVITSDTPAGESVEGKSGFRGIACGQAPTKTMVLTMNERDGELTHFSIPREEVKFGTLHGDTSEHLFWKNQFFWGFMTLEPELFQKAVDTARSTYGEPTGKQGIFPEWAGKTVRVTVGLIPSWKHQGREKTVVSVSCIQLFSKMQNEIGAK